MRTNRIPQDEPWRVRAARQWNAFWFTPRDPTLLGLIRICCGALTLYNLVLYSLTLDDFVGPTAWLDHEYMLERVYRRPLMISSLSGSENPPVAPSTLEEDLYVKAYLEKFGEPPPPPFPRTKAETDYLDAYRRTWQFDLRAYGLPPPQNEQQFQTAMKYTELYKSPMPPPYPESEQHAEEISQYIKRYGVDPRRLYARGVPTFSIWYHIRDPFWQRVMHGFAIGVVLLFTLGVGTRVTSVLSWFIVLNYIHRNFAVLFGTDQMMMILLLYLAIGPSGAALSVDRLLARWRAGRSSGGGWTPAEAPAPSVTANLALRLLQIHLCIIYFVAGVSKLQGNAWWNGTALWPVLANFEFAPMNWAVYNWVLRFLGRHQLMFETVMTGGVYFTLVFEIGYPFLIWRPSCRWLFLASAILLHGVIGLFMGLQTFALFMLVMNMGFLRDDEARNMLEGLGLNLSVPKT